MKIVSKIRSHKDDLFLIAVSKISRQLGGLFGFISRIIPPKRCKVWANFLNGYHTSRWKFSFKHFGRNSILYHNTQVLDPQNITIGDDVIFFKDCILESWYTAEKEIIPTIVIGNHCRFGEYTHITSSNKIVIGDNLLTGRFVLITDNTHGKMDGRDLEEHPAMRELVSKGPIHIGKNVWLADKVSIMPGVSIGDGSVIAANAVVTHDIPANSLAAGIPAKVIRKLKD